LARATSGNHENTLYHPLPLAGEGRGEGGYHYAFPPHCVVMRHPIHRNIRMVGGRPTSSRFHKSIYRERDFILSPQGERNIVKAYFLSKARE